MVNEVYHWSVLTYPCVPVELNRRSSGCGILKEKETNIRY